MQFRSMGEMPVTANEHDLRTGLSVPPLGSVSGEWRPNCALTMIPASPQRVHQGGAAGEWDGRDPRPTREQVPLLIVSPVCFIPERQLGTIPYT